MPLLPVWSLLQLVLSRPILLYSIIINEYTESFETYNHYYIHIFVLLVIFVFGLSFSYLFAHIDLVYIVKTLVT